MQIIHDGSITSPSGFMAAATYCGLRETESDDLALVVSSRDCSAAGVFTRNQVQAAPVIVDRRTLAANVRSLRAVVANSGTANACTGTAGLQAAVETQAVTARAVGCRADQVLVLSTGLIGFPLDIKKLTAGVDQAAALLSPDAGVAAARAIMTTDTRPKHLALQLEFPEGNVILGGIAKGSGMIHPDMATMLGVITTDAALSPTKLAKMLNAAVDLSFNRISVDGDTSTNDTVLMLANGASGVAIDSPERMQAFSNALTRLCTELAKAIVRDGEGASKFITLQVVGARNEREAVQVGRTVATSPLVKTALAGGDPNWGRIMAAVGRAGVPLDRDALSLAIGEGEQADLELVHNGQPVPADIALSTRLFSAPEVTILLDLGLGTAAATVWTCDLTHAYITINAEYHT